LQRNEKLKKRSVALIYSNNEKTRVRRICNIAVKAQDEIMPLTELRYDSRLVLSRRIMKNNNQ